MAERRRQPPNRGKSAPKRTKSPRRRAIDRKEGYFHLSQRPLHILIFLSPLIALYELGSAVSLHGAQSGAAETIRAHRLMSGFFEAFGVGGLFLPGILMIVVLLIWHVLRRDPWRIELPVLGGMLVESAALALPLIVLGQMIGRALSRVVSHAPEALALAAGGASNGAAMSAFAELSWQARATIAVGAGLYEELLFRMVAISVLHLLAVDVLGMKPRMGAALAVVISAAAFALYHDVWLAGGGLEWGRTTFYFAAGLYFGGLYVLRGFGIVVATHAIYDLIVLLAR